MSNQLDHTLLWAAGQGYTDVVRGLLTIGANVHAYDDAALIDASECGHTESVRILLDAGADVHAQEDKALRSVTDAETMRILLEAGANVHVRAGAPLFNATDQGNPECVRLLLEAGAVVNTQTLIIATSVGATQCVRLLLQAGADVHANDYKELIKASTLGYVKIVRLLLTAGARFNVPAVKAALLRITSFSLTNDWMALALGHASYGEVADLLLRHLRRPDVPDVFLSRWYPLQLSAVKRLIKFHRECVSPRTHRPPTGTLPLPPTRAGLVAHLATAGKSFAHAYWDEGLPLFFPGVDLGPNPFP